MYSCLGLDFIINITVHTKITIAKYKDHLPNIDAVWSVNTLVIELKLWTSSAKTGMNSPILNFPSIVDLFIATAKGAINSISNI